MKIAFLSVLFKRYPLERAFQVAKEQGYDGVEIWGGRPHAYPFDGDETLYSSIRRLQDQYQLEVPMFTPELLSYPFNISSSDPKTWEETERYLKKSIDFAEGIGCPRVMFAMGHAGFGTKKSENMLHVVSVIRKMADYANQADVNIILEAVTHMESNTVVFLDDLLEILQEVNCPHVKAMLDTVTPCVHWETYTDYFERLGEKLDYIHFVDCDGEGFHHYPIGEGRLPMEALVRIIKKNHYDGWLSSEIISPYLADPELYAARELRTIKKLLEEEGNQ